MPAAWNHSAISWLSAAAPEMKKRTRPPKRSRTLAKTSLSNSAVLDVEDQRPGLRPSRLALSTASPTLNACLKIASLAPPSAACMVTMRRVRLLEDPRRRAHERRLHHAEVVDDLVDAAVDRGGVAASRAGWRAAPCRRSAPSAASGTRGRPR